MVDSTRRTSKDPELPRKGYALSNKSGHPLPQLRGWLTPLSIAPIGDECGDAARARSRNGSPMCPGPRAGLSRKIGAQNPAKIRDPKCLSAPSAAAPGSTTNFATFSSSPSTDLSTRCEAYHHLRIRHPVARKIFTSPNLLSSRLSPRCLLSLASLRE